MAALDNDLACLMEKIESEIRIVTQLSHPTLFSHEFDNSQIGLSILINWR